MDNHFHDAIETILTQLPQKQIAVIGDFFLDKYLVIDPALDEPSLETGKTANQVVEIYHSPGAAGNVMANLAAMGVGKLWAIGAIGKDGQAHELLNDLQQMEIDTRYLTQHVELFTPTYTKPMRREEGKLIEQERLDIRNRSLLPAEIENQILANLEECLPQLDGIIICDQVEEVNVGVITENVRNQLIELADKYPEKIFFADSRARISYFRNVIIKPNKYEVYRSLFNKTATAVTLEEAREHGKSLAAQTQRPVIITLEKEGALACTATEAVHVPGITVTGEIDSVGAGDSMASATMAALCTGVTLEEAVFMGNVVASITIQKLGTTGTATPAEIRAQNRSVQ